ncbi:serine/threonine-protein kinase, partial [Actinomadura rubrobrunea]
MPAVWRVAGFEELRELGAGAQGRVVLARHEESGTPVAIKYVSADAEQRELLRREAVLLGRVDDPHVARLYRLVESEYGAALVMEAIDGVSLKRVLEHHGALEPEAALLVMKGSLLGLAAAHRVGVVHRDYKPSNVVVRSDGLSKLIDFGIAVVAGQGGRSGTPAYMAPEQWRGEPAVPATDVYAATCVFFECLTGRRPFVGDSAEALREAHLHAPPPVEEAPEAVRSLLSRGMAKSAEERPGEVAEFVREVEAAASAAYGPDWESRAVRALAGAAAALASLFPLAALFSGGGSGGAAISGAAGAAGETAAAGGTGGAAASGGATAAAGAAG